MTDNDLIREAFDMAKSTLAPAQKWISVKDRLPDREQSVLLLCKNKAMFTGCHFLDYNNESRWRIHTALNSTKLLNRGRVTHWMPLPKPPKED